ncbi:TRAP transporter small permease subunit [Seohaeicola sp. SP36]|jgi:TRAP-type mannitol/chloroaromatic compound transport system permease small subunit|uniref:TRAP transporter small permease subunit n=1 Tax=unclassified Seohaeicola TaxID=2641111 RepID=UPI00237B73ED|nr:MULTISPECIES: TRAP transporter small permease subunit [unclassified Seohaeicola]MDD9707710.1 TRAP transporter small permease subunit [Seohaeicola sp. 4SK31]MDD9735952.1 TRAP transporter small permease subunit [Seohaeicola sp. SP36]MDF1707910.1 TRAP transporter small permease subunit [Paracoccaceae bacterium]
MPAILTKLLDLLCLPGKWVSWLILPLIASILIAVVYAKMGLNTLMAWDAQLPVLGRALTVNGLFDLQWYIFALLVLFGGAWALRDDKHVAVDFLSLMMTQRQRLWTRMLGDLLFLLPFCLIIAWYGWSFALTAWTTGEGSTQGGLNSRWIIKAMVPLSFAILGLMGLLRGLGTAVELLRGTTDKDQKDLS